MDTCGKWATASRTAAMSIYSLVSLRARTDSWSTTHETVFSLPAPLWPYLSLVLQQEVLQQTLQKVLPAVARGGDKEEKVSGLALPPTVAMRLIEPPAH